MDEVNISEDRLQISWSGISLEIQQRILEAVLGPNAEIKNDEEFQIQVFRYYSNVAGINFI